MEVPACKSKVGGKGAEQVKTTLEILGAHGEDAYVIGKIVAGEEKIELC